MNGHSSVDDRGLNGLLLNYRLDVFMDVVVDVLASNGWIGRRGVLGISDSTSILELACSAARRSLTCSSLPCFKLRVSTPAIWWLCCSGRTSRSTAVVTFSCWVRVTFS